jgi:O-antigen/teichoic acid export membrane protein
MKIGIMCRGSESVFCSLYFDSESHSDIDGLSSVENSKGNTPPASISPGHHLLQGTVLVLMSEILLPLTGLVTVSFLTRRLGAGNYGLLMLAATLVSWIEYAISSLFSRATVKIIGDAEDWRPIGTAALRLYTYISTLAMLGCWILAKPLAAALSEPKLAVYFALFALDLPIFALAQCHRSILIGKGKYAERARMSAGRWIARLALIILLVELGLSVSGAILGSIGASLVELAIARYYIRPAWKTSKAAPFSLWDYAVPIFLATMCLRLMNLSLFLLKMLGASAAQVGIYGAAQNVSFVMPGIFAVSLSPLLLSTLTRVMRENNLPAARVLGRNSLRAVVVALPLAAVASAASDEIAVLLFGAPFSAAGSLMAVLVFAGLAMMLINLLNAVLIACGSPIWTLKLAAPLLPLAIAGHLFAIPRFGPMGAAAVTVIVACIGAFAGLIAVWKRIRISLPLSSLLRAFVLSAAVYPLMYFWHTPGFAVIGKMAVGLLLVLGGFVALGEFSKNEIQFFRSIIVHALSKSGSRE